MRSSDRPLTILLDKVRLTDTSKSACEIAITVFESPCSHLYSIVSAANLCLAADQNKDVEPKLYLPPIVLRILLQPGSFCICYAQYLQTKKTPHEGGAHFFSCLQVLRSPSPHTPACAGFSLVGRPAFDSVENRSNNVVVGIARIGGLVEIGCV
jgi:hypothetical protein